VVESKRVQVKMPSMHKYYINNNNFLYNLIANHCFYIVLNESSIALEASHHGNEVLLKDNLGFNIVTTICY
jgi:hypothetical protein